MKGSCAAKAGYSLKFIERLVLADGVEKLGFLAIALKSGKPRPFNWPQDRRSHGEQ